jgi:uncharacterized protein YgbK (DUF1537 family)
MTSPLLFGGIADDFTGAVELAGMLAAGGAHTVLATGPAAIDGEAEAVVIATRSRVAPPQDALDSTGAAAEALLARGARQLFLKYCATFDSLDTGNIGNVAELLAERGGASSVLFCPSFPEALRTVYQGHHFVGDSLLSESPKRHDPLTPMTQPDLVRVLQPQTTRKVGLLPWGVVQQGAGAIRAHAAQRFTEGIPFLIADAITPEDLRSIAEASWDWPVMTGGSSVAAYYPALWRARGLLSGQAPEPLEGIGGTGAVLAGSCAERTREQIAAFAQHHPVLHLDPLENAEPAIARALAWAENNLPKGPVCIATSADPERVAAAQAQLGPIAAGRRAEALLGRLAQGLVARGVRRLMVAGGETSGAVVQALGIDQLRVAPYVELGVGRCMADAPVRLALCLKSGKLGETGIFAKTLAAMEHAA